MPRKPKTTEQPVARERPRRQKATEPRVAQEQPYDSSFRALIDDQTLVVLSFLLKEEVIYAKELKESLFKRDAVRPALRVDCAYDVQSRKSDQGPIRKYILHVEVETAPTSEIGQRMLEYRGGLHRKHKRPIAQVLVCPFEMSNLPTTPYRMEYDEDGELLLESRYPVVALWKEEASKLLASGKVEVFSLLPAMKGATYELLTQALKAMKAFYVGDESRLCMHWLWFGTLLDRTTTVSQEDKERTRIEMSESESLLDSNPFVRARVAKARAEALAEVEKARAEALAEGLQEALVVTVELRFPALLALAQERVRQTKEPETLRFVLKGVKTAPSEETAHFLLDTLAA